MKKPIIGITLDSEESGQYSKFPWYAIRKNHLFSIEKFGGIPFPLFHSSASLPDILSIVDGIIITGGNFDIDPALYGENNDHSRSLKNTRTNFEMKICEMSLKNNLPILGICGGEQLLNICFGGTLIQDIRKYNKNSLEHEQVNPRNETSHSVEIKKQTKLFEIIKDSEIKVNSAHHQAVNKLGKNLIISGLARDGIVESIESTEHDWCIGVQWHPEFLITKADKLLISNFIEFSQKKL
jgi:putative glutamine amidotransferase